MADSYQYPMAAEARGQISSDGSQYIQQLPDGRFVVYEITPDGQLGDVIGQSNASGEVTYQPPSQSNVGEYVDMAQDLYNAYDTGSDIYNGVTAANSAAQAAGYGETAYNAYGATEAALGLNQAADAALMYDAAGNAIGTSAAGSLGSGSGILGANGATLGTAGVGLAALPVAALYGYQVPRTWANLTSKDSEKKWQGATEAALLASGVFSWAAPLARLGFDLFDTGKPEDQQQRDVVRKGAKERGFYDSDYKINLPDGSTFDFGLDGSERLKNLGQNIDGKTERGRYDVDFSNADAGYYAGMLNPLGELMSLGTDKSREQTTGSLVNASNYNEDNAMDLYRRAGITDRQSASDMIESLRNRKDSKGQSVLAPGEYEAYMNAMDDLFNVGAYADKNKKSASPSSSSQKAPAPQGMNSGPIYKPAATPTNPQPVRTLELRLTPQEGEQVRSQTLPGIARGPVTKPQAKPLTTQRSVRNLWGF